MKSVLTFRFFSILYFFLFTFWSFNVPDIFAEEDQCLRCHAELTKPSKSIHAPLTSGCQTCHTLVEGRNHPEHKDSVKLKQDIPGLCYSCHDKSKFKGKSLHPPVVNDMCTTCHDAHQSTFEKLLLRDIPGLCYNCHNESKFRGKLVHAPVAKGLCMRCHSPHASNFNSILISDSPEICYRCHDKGPFTKKHIHVVIAVPNGCNLCHNAHASDSPHLLSKPIIELCTGCHKAQEKGMHLVAPVPGQIVHPVTGVPDPSNPKRELSCVSCHNPHSSNFPKLFPIARICSKCHPYY